MEKVLDSCVLEGDSRDLAEEGPRPTPEYLGRSQENFEGCRAQRYSSMEGICLVRGQLGPLSSARNDP